MASIVEYTCERFFSPRRRLPYYERLSGGTKTTLGQIARLFDNISYIIKASGAPAGTAAQQQQQPQPQPAGDVRVSEADMYFPDVVEYLLDPAYERLWLGFVGGRDDIPRTHVYSILALRDEAAAAYETIRRELEGSGSTKVRGLAGAVAVKMRCLEGLSMRYPDNVPAKRAAGAPLTLALDRRSVWVLSFMFWMLVLGITIGSTIGHHYATHLIQWLCALCEDGLKLTRSIPELPWSTRL